MIHKILEALAHGRRVFLTDGTVTRLVCASAPAGDDLAVFLDNERHVIIEESDFDSVYGLMDSDEGLYIAPVWWIEL